MRAPFALLTPPSAASSASSTPQEHSVNTEHACAVQSALDTFQTSAHPLHSLSAIVGGLLDAGGGAVLRGARRTPPSTPLKRHPILEPDTFAFGPHAITASDQVFLHSEHAFASVNLAPIVPGHSLIVSKRPAERMGQLTPAEIADLWSLVHRVQAGLERLLGTSAATVVLQDGPAAGQSVPHVHVHVMPRQEHDLEHASAGASKDGDEVYDMLKGSEGALKDTVEGVVGGGSARAARPPCPAAAALTGSAAQAVDEGAAGWAAWVVRCAGLADDGSCLPAGRGGGAGGVLLAGNVQLCNGSAAAAAPKAGQRRVKRAWVVRGRPLGAMRSEASALRKYFEDMAHVPSKPVGDSPDLAARASCAQP